MYKVSVLAINHGMRKFRIPFASVDQVTSLFIFWLFTLFNTRGLKVFRKIFERVVFLEPKYLEKPWESLGKLLILCLKRPPEPGAVTAMVFFFVSRCPRPRAHLPSPPNLFFDLTVHSPGFLKKSKRRKVYSGMAVANSLFSFSLYQNKHFTIIL
jgi:hypothetical protein